MNYQKLILSLSATLLTIFAGSALASNAYNDIQVNVINEIPSFIYWLKSPTLELTTHGESLGSNFTFDGNPLNQTSSETISKNGGLLPIHISDKTSSDSHSKPQFFALGFSLLTSHGFKDHCLVYTNVKQQGFKQNFYHPLTISSTNLLNQGLTCKVVSRGPTSETIAVSYPIL